MRGMSYVKFKIKGKTKESVTISVKNYFIKEHLSTHKISFSNDAKIEVGK